MRRTLVIGTVLLVIALFLVVSALLTRVLSVGSAEDAAIGALVRAEARGDAGGVAALIFGCGSSGACRARAVAVATTLRHPGQVSIVQIQESAGFSLTATVGTARVVWIVGSSLPRTQCVRVHRAGSVLAGFRIQLLRVSRRIVTDAACPARF